MATARRDPAPKIAPGNHYRDAALMFSPTCGNRRREQMVLDGRLPEGLVVVCTGGGEQHSFLARRLGPSVECPECGRTALSADLIQDYYDRNGHPAPAEFRAAAE